MQFTLGHHHQAFLGVGAFRRLIPTQRITNRSIRLYSSLPSTVCTSCGAPLPTRLPACPKCSHIERPIHKFDYYELLETPKSPNPFIINESQLKNSFRRMQRYVHPDLWASQGEVRCAEYDFAFVLNPLFRERFKSPATYPGLLTRLTALFYNPCRGSVTSSHNIAST